MLAHLKEAGVPIDGIGVQMHVENAVATGRVPPDALDDAVRRVLVVLGVAVPQQVIIMHQETRILNQQKLVLN